MSIRSRRGSAFPRGLAVAAGLVFALSTSSRAQNAVGPPPDPDPEVERRSFIVADGFEVNLYAADPLIAKPIQMNFDPAGRLWIASSEVYPQIKPGQEANDKILVLEDKDGDGRAEKTTVFADGLLIPTGVEPGDGGVYVANSTELLHLKDTDGDGKADSTRVVLSGFGTEDTHHLLHTLRWGHDGMLYFNQSIYIHSHIETPHGVRRLNGGGIWRFRPETMELDVFIRGLVNGWGHQVDAWGQSFATDGAGGEGINYCLPGAYYVTAVDAVRLLKGLNPGSPKYCGLEVASGRHLPDSWQGSLLTNDFRGNRVCRFVVSDDGAGFSSREQSELIKTKHVSFRPIDVLMGPDGAIYIADWYNPIIQHGEVDFRDPRRDHTRGRIWRVTAKNRPVVERPKLVDAAVPALLEALKAPEEYTRRQAKRVLKERGPAAVGPVLSDWVATLDPADPDFERNRLEGLWTFQALDVARPALLEEALNSKDARVRAAAARIVPFWKSRVTDPDELLAPLVADEAPRVRLEAVRSLARMPNEKSAELALKALDKPVDGFLDYALWLAARDLAPAWLPAVRAGRFDFGGDARRLVFALESMGSPDVLQPLLALYKEGRVPHEQDAAALNLIAAVGGPAELGLLLDLIGKKDALPPARQSALLTALVRAGRERKIVPAGDLARIGPLLTQPDESLRSAAAAAVGAWKIAGLRPKLAELAVAAEASAPLRLEAIRGLIAFADPESVALVAKLAEPGGDSLGQTLAIASLASHDPAAVADRAAKWLAGLKAARLNEAQAVLTSFLGRRDGPAALAKALAAVKLDPDLAKLAVRDIRANGRSAQELIDALAKSGSLGDTNRTYPPEEKASILAELAKGDPVRGEAIFRREDMTCLKCHAIAGAGGQVGPSMESIGASAPIDYLLDSILEPNKAVKENFHATVVATNEGRIVTGIRVRQTDSELVLRDAEDQEIAIPLDAIEEQKVAGSIMPAGLTEPLTRPELVDLVRFLSELGKIGDYAVSKERVLRRWRALASTKEAATAMIRSSVEAVIQGQDALPWKTAYATVGGRLVPSELPANPRVSGAPPMTLVRSDVEVTTPGAVRLKFDSARDLAFWIDGRRVEPDPKAPDALTVELDRGVHALYVGFEPGRRGDGFRCVLEDVEGSPAQVRPVLGK
ncbi:PVC-type heme-binding CxxCH protein [Paludisphaera mucosa]|uniref:HEAT repeat domain-containing protein n=1 Tax=Paludisphaera mucosa TaxID=3030827 RepID=A0ABT6F8Z6_9BACT|nr:PVC-type heme-binding CxxCH protein [Paludisphaera mucosa]MDG3004025.1 HEAT repeat domain-containing protein [Paludisphaera mucosa]